jgi:Tfp pilus assembly protein PilX
MDKLIYGGGSMNEEDGFILPVVLVLIAVLSTLFLFACKEWTEEKRYDQMRFAMVQAGYAAESAIAQRQNELKANPDDFTTVQKKYGSYVVDVSVFETEAGTLVVQAIAKGKNGIQQTETVELNKQTLHILYWLE